MINKSLIALAVWMAACFAAGSLVAPLSAHAQSEASVGLSLMPVASVVGAASATGAAAGAVVALPAALSVGGAALSVVAVESVEEGTVYVLERASDGARASIRLTGRAAHAASVGVGSAVAISVIGTGVVLSAAGEVLAFIPNAIGRALLYDERLS
ncbi:hypothetical protein [Variovorax sp. PBL-E5]|uniref:hypothetical protein n=1 Tax=Variovorax sp. PBL-E5 TaxID=434014 RepID=UPI0013184A89|nr:hypothetical protein [Variovorax sp. PBL-E5]VTU17947.1 hypothetical protein E5CHR_00488 [Variovorax sp. PBL-E5]